MNKITSIAELEALYGEAVPASLEKVRDHITPLYAQWIMASKFLVLSTVGSEGTDASPRGDDGPVVSIKDDKTLLLPDWRGNNRLDSLRNIVIDGRVSLMFMIAGNNNVVRVNGDAILTTDDSVTTQFTQRETHPRSVVVVSVREVYFQCAKALMRSGLWRADHLNDVPAESEPATADTTASAYQNPAVTSTVPTAGEFIKEQNHEFDAEGYDSGYAEYAKPRMW